MATLKRMASIAALICLVVSFGFAGGSDDQAAAGEPDVITLMTWAHGDPAYPYNNERPAIKHIMEELNVTFDAQVMQFSDLSDQLALLLAAGGEMPDLYIGYPTNVAAGDILQRGLIKDWAEVVDEGRMPMLAATKSDSEWDAFWNQHIQLDGTIPTLTSKVSRRLIVWSTLYRKDWAERVGFADDPATLQEYRDMLKAIVVGDPNGNGQPDEVGITVFHSWPKWVNHWGRAFGIKWLSYEDPQQVAQISVENGEMYFVPTSDRFRAVLEFLNGMWEDGILDPEIFFMDSPKFTAKTVDNTLASYHHNISQTSATVEQLRASGVEDAYVRAIRLPKDPNWYYGNDPITAPTATWWTNYIMIQPDGSWNEAIARVADYTLADNEFQIFREFGEEGVHHERVGTQYNFLGDLADIPAGQPITGAMGSYVYWLPHQYNNVNAHQKIDVDPLYAEVRAWEAEHTPYANAPVWKWTPDQQAAKTAAEKAMFDYLNESFTQFITGDKPFSEWDAYVAVLNDEYGDEIRTLVDMRQAYFDEKLANMYIE